MDQGSVLGQMFYYQSRCEGTLNSDRVVVLLFITSVFVIILENWLHRLTRFDGGISPLKLRIRSLD